MTGETLSLALKEWAAVVRALEEGTQILLFRKGGIREVDDEFQVEEPQFLLYPTFEHQNAELVKPEYQPLISESEQDRPGRLVRVSSFARVEKIVHIRERSLADAVFDQHIWNQKYVDMRLNYKPERPLFVLMLRVYRLAEAIQFQEKSAYIGCRSWVQLEEKAELAGARPVLSREEFESRVQQAARLGG